MSTDYDVACLSCRLYTHLGQRMANKYSFGWGSQDADGRRRVWGFIDEHTGHYLRIYECNETPDHLTHVSLDSVDPAGDP